jgi:hypothetical protein
MRALPVAVVVEATVVVAVKAFNEIQNDWGIVGFSALGMGNSYRRAAETAIRIAKSGKPS